MNTLELATGGGRSYKKVSMIHGGEYHGPCPGCQGTDRFHVWPHQGEHGTFWCRQCGKSGDAIEYLMTYEGKSFPEACKTVGKELPENQEYQTPRIRKQDGDPAGFTLRTTTDPGERWRQHAEKLVEWAHQQLLASPDRLQWLAARGLDLEAVKEFRLGWNPGEKGRDLYRVRESWGLETLLKDDNKPKKLWLPVGLIIPYCVRTMDGMRLHRVRIRRPEGKPRYYVVPGSGTAPMVLGDDARAFVVVESELDAMLIRSKCRDLVGAISQGNSSAKPDDASFSCLKGSLSILVALDSDDAGMTESVWWRKNFPQAERHPVPAGKDPGEAFSRGVDIREWIKVGLPPILTLPPRAAASWPATEQPNPVKQENSVYENEQVYILQGKSGVSGLTYYIVPDISARRKLTEQHPGEAIFTHDEIRKLKGVPAADAEKFILVKQTFGPDAEISHITRGE